MQLCYLDQNILNKSLPGSNIYYIIECFISIKSSGCPQPWFAASTAALLRENVGKAPFISRQLVEDKIRKANRTKGGVPGERPVKLEKEFGPKLSVPASQTFQKVALTGIWPKRWRTERGISLKKVPEPTSEQ